MDTLSLCLIVKDENDYLREWLDYHRLLGVERFYIYDNDSREPVRRTLAEDIARGWVVVHEISGYPVQLTAYDHCLRAYGAQSRWIGFIDTDEFLVPKTATDLRTFLELYEDYGGLAVHWQQFGSGGSETRPAEGTLLGYRWRTPPAYPQCSTIKSIVRPDRVLIPFSPHHFTYRPGAFCVNEHYERVDHQAAPPTTERIQLNHYWARSREEFLAKLARGRGDGGKAYALAQFDRVDRAAVVEDTSALAVLEAWSTQTGAAQHGLGTQAWLRLQAAKLPDPQERVRASDLPLEPQPLLAELSRLNQAYTTAQQRGSSAGCETVLSEFVRRFPSMIVPWAELAVLLLQKQPPETDQSWELLAHAWRTAPNNDQVLWRMSQFFTAVGDRAQAEKAARLRLARDPEGVNARLYLADVLLRHEKIDEALQHIQIAVTASPDALYETEARELLKRLGLYYYHQGALEKAAELFALPLPAHPEDLDLLINLARVEFDLGRFREAEAHLLAAGQVEPGNEEVQAGLRLLHKAQSAPVPYPLSAG